MNNSFIPIVFKEKLANIINWFKGSLFFSYISGDFPIGVYVQYQ